MFFQTNRCVRLGLITLVIFSIIIVMAIIFENDEEIDHGYSTEFERVFFRLMTASRSAMYQNRSAQKEYIPSTPVASKSYPSQNTIHSPPYVYHKGNNITLTGQRFPICTCNDMSPNYFVDMENTDLNNFIFMTAASDNHFEESKDLVASIQHKFPDRKLYYYDIGLSSSQVKQVKSWCNTVYRRFDVYEYPQHIRRLNTCAFKPIMMYDAFQEFEAILWLDASGRINKTANSNKWQKVFTTAKATGGVVQFDGTGRDVFQCTTPGMYDFLPGDEDKLKTYEMIGAGAALFYRTRKVYTQILHWWRLCALTKKCMEPKGHNLNCGNVAQPGVSLCHRYDQSALNILVGNMLNYEMKTLPIEAGHVIDIERYPTNNYELQTNCRVNE